ncbi:MAG: CpsB/CapC family capsule biosynthesis tyrosine phosphatase [Ruminococcus sp.]
MQYFDMHSHILPSFDDGAETVDDSLGLLDCLKKQGVSNVCFTPHFYTNEMSVERFLEKRRVAYENFLPYKPVNMNIVLGAEVYVSKYLFSSDDLSELTYGKSRYILTEFSYSSSFSNKSMHQLNMLIENHRLIPVLPHVERYDILINDTEALRELRDMGVVIQTNIGNYTKKSSIFKRRKLLKLIGDGMIDILGTDAHSMTHNTPEVYAQAVEMIAEKCGQITVRKMMQNAEKIFTAALGEPLGEEYSE